MTFFGDVDTIRYAGPSDEDVLRAVRDLPFNVPVNIILYAMEGDPQAAPAYWWLALRTGGSMMAPSEDWP